MNSASLRLLLMLCLLLAAGARARAQGHDDAHPSGQPHHAPAPGGPVAPLLDGMGTHHFEITTAVPAAQRFFDQGLVLAYGFNHAEAERSFREAARLDPQSAMPYWGIAYVLGPNINAAMEAADAPRAYDALRQALERAPGATPREQAYIRALAARYAPAPPAGGAALDRAALDRAYAEAMRAVAAQYPGDPDAATLLAEALMVTTPWDYWLPDGEPKGVMRDALAALEGVMARDPDHPGALHYYIHAVEAVHPEKGVAAADRLGDLVPGAGHLVHMPAHIYIRVGRYQDAIAANERATAADAGYLTQCRMQGLYPVLYVPHNHHFLWVAATMAGASEKAIVAARHMAAHTDTVAMRQPGFGAVQHYYMSPLFAYVRFGRWDDVLAYPRPAADLPYPTALWHYARGMAHVRSGRVDEAGQELRQLGRFVRDPLLEALTIWGLNPTSSVVKIAREMLAGEIAAAKGDVEAAVRALRAAAELEDGLNYDEPSPWTYPARHSLGAVLLEAGRPAEAEQVYRDDLAANPENGWALFGLAESLRAQQRPDEAAAVQARFEKAWSHADVQITSSRF